jgi:fatty acid amide hydrolase
MSRVETWRLSATRLSALLASGEARSRDIVEAQLARIDAVDTRVRAFVEVFRESALAEAEASDARRRAGQALGPLDGVPVSVKECFDHAGRPTTLGIPSWRGRIAERDAAMVQALRGAGAVILGRTNLSQTMVFLEARNPLFGETSNPWSLAHTPGGSSGGCAAAVASGMTPLSVGTDIGGSVRVPAHYCGVVALKPTLDRLPMRGYRTVNAGQEAVRAQAGPLAREVGDVSLLFRALDPARSTALDPRVPPLAWSDPSSVDLRGLRVGVATDDGILAPSQALVRAVDRAARALEARHAEVKPFPLPDARAVMSAYLGAMSADGGAALLAALAGGPVDPVLEPMRRMVRVPASVRRAAARAAMLMGQPGLGLMLESLGEKTAGALWQLTDDLRRYRANLLDEMARAGVSLLLCPPSATPAHRQGGSKNFVLAAARSMVFNATQFPAGVVPVTRVLASETVRPTGRDLLEQHAARVDASSEGLPVGVQVVGVPWQDHVVVAAMKAIEEDVSRDSGFPATPVEPPPSRPSPAGRGKVSD